MEALRPIQLDKRTPSLIYSKPATTLPTQSLRSEVNECVEPCLHAPGNYYGTKVTLFHFNCKVSSRLILSGIISAAHTTYEMRGWWRWIRKREKKWQWPISKLPQQPHILTRKTSRTWIRSPAAPVGIRAGYVQAKNVEKLIDVYFLRMRAHYIRGRPRWRNHLCNKILCRSCKGVGHGSLNNWAHCGIITSRLNDLAMFVKDVLSAKRE